MAASEIAGTLPLMKVSDYLTAIAEVVLAEVLELALRDVQMRHGSLPGIAEELPFIIVVVAYRILSASSCWIVIPMQTMNEYTSTCSHAIRLHNMVMVLL